MFYDEREHEVDDTDLLGDVLPCPHNQRRFRSDQKPFNIDLMLPEAVTSQLLEALLCGDTAKTPKERATAGAVLANLLLHSNGVFYSRDKNLYASVRRYKPDHISYLSVTRVVDRLAERKALCHSRQLPSPYNAWRSHFCAAPELVELLQLHKDVEFSSPIREPIILRDDAKRPIAYRDCRATRAARSQVLAFNEFMDGVNLTIDFPGTRLVGNRILMLNEQVFDLQRKSLVRVFNRDLRSNGRFYRAFWQNLPSSVRAEGLRINGEAVIEVDFTACHFRILCGLIGRQLPFAGRQFDPFAVPRYERRLIKKSFNILLNTNNKHDAARALANDLSEQEGLQRFHTAHYELARRLIETVLELFPYLDRFWCRQFGLRLMNVDAAICAEVVSILNAHGVPCLSVHDSFIVPRDHAGLLRDVMEHAFKLVVARARKVGEAGITLGL